MLKEPSEYPSFGAYRIALIMEENNISSDADFASLIGVHRQIIYDIKHGRCNISANVARCIKNVFPNYDASWVRFGVGNPISEPKEINVTATAMNNSTAHAQYGSQDALAVLRKENEMLKNQVKEYSEMIDFLKGLLNGK